MSLVHRGPRRELGFEPLALVAMLVYASASYLLTPEFPFTIVDMYARVGHRREGATPVMLVDDGEVDVRTLTDFRGIAPEDIVPGHMPCSEAYRLDEIRNHVAAHMANAESSPGDLAIAFAWRRYHIDASGAVVEDPMVVVRAGTARRLRER